MRIAGFEWNDWNINHIDKHGVTPQEVEEACYNQPICRKTRDRLYIIYGQSDTGRYMFAVLKYEPKGIVYVITARTMTDNEKRYYDKRR